MAANTFSDDTTFQDVVLVKFGTGGDVRVLWDEVGDTRLEWTAADATLLGFLDPVGDMSLTPAGDLLITPGGADVVIVGRLAVGANAVATAHGLNVEGTADDEVTGFRLTRSGATTQYIEMGTSSTGLLNFVGVNKDFIYRNSSTTTGDILLQTAGANTRMILAFGGNVGFGNITPTIFVSANEKIGWTSIGGMAIKLTNETGGNSVEGELVKADTVTDSAVILTAAGGTGDDDVIGVFFESGIADAAEAWVVVSGKAEVRSDATGGWSKADRIVASTATAGRGEVNNAPAVANHFAEIGHANEDVAGANTLGLCTIHLN